MKNVRLVRASAGFALLGFVLGISGCTQLGAEERVDDSSAQQEVLVTPWPASAETTQRLSVASFRLTKVSKEETLWEGLSASGEVTFRARLTRPPTDEKSLNVEMEIPERAAFQITESGKVTGDSSNPALVDALTFAFADFRGRLGWQSDACTSQGLEFAIAASCVGSSEAEAASEGPSLCQEAIAARATNSGCVSSRFATLLAPVKAVPKQWILKSYTINGILGGLLTRDKYDVLYVETGAAQGREVAVGTLVNNSGKTITKPFNYSISQSKTISATVNLNVVKDVLGLSGSFSFTASDTISDTVVVPNIKPGERHTVYMATIGDRFTITRERLLFWADRSEHSSDPNGGRLEKIKFTAFVPTGISLRPVRIP